MRLPELASRFVVLSAVLLSALVPHEALAQTDLPRVLIIFDTSKSMRFTPSEAAEYPNMDYDPPTAANSTTVCAQANQSDTLTVTCPAGNTITSVEYAYYGRAAENQIGCGMGTTAPVDNTSGCNLGNSVKQDGVFRGWRKFNAFVEEQCVGKATCSFEVNNSTLSNPSADLNPCESESKYGVVSVTCGADSCPPGSGSKFCLGKRAVWNVIKANKDKVEFASAGYFQQYWEKTNPEIPAGFVTSCRYDVMAGGNEWWNTGGVGARGTGWYDLNNVAPSLPAAGVDVNFACNPETMVSANAVGGSSPVALNGTCTPGQPAKACAMRWQWRNSFTTAGGAAWNGARYQHPDVACQPNVPTTMAAYTLGCVPSLGDPDTQFAGPPTVHSAINVPAANVPGGCAAATPYFADRFGANNVYGTGVNGVCTAGTPCAYYRYPAGDASLPNQTMSFYQDKGMPVGGPPATITIGGVTYTQRTVAGPSAPFTVNITTVPGATPANCPASVVGYNNAAIAGCNGAGGPCDLTRSGVATPTTTYTCPSGSWTLSGTNCSISYPNRRSDGLTGGPVNGVTLTVQGAQTWSGGYSYTIPLTTYVANGRVCDNEGSWTINSNTYKGTAVPCGANTNATNAVGSSTCQARFASKQERSDLGVAICSFELKNVTYGATTPATPNYFCAYTRMTYTYQNFLNYCAYRLYQFQFQHRRYEYNFKLNAGDYVNSPTMSVAYPTTAPAGSEYCLSTNAPALKPHDDATGFAGVPSGQPCRAELAPGVGPCPASASRCKLRWGSAMNQRFANYAGAGTGGLTDKLHPYGSNGPRPGCPVGDPAANDGVAPNLPSPYAAIWSDWCQSNAGGQPYVPRSWQPKVLMADYYQPTQSNAAASRATWQGAYWDGTTSNPFGHSERAFDRFWWVDETTPLPNLFTDLGVIAGPLGNKTQGLSLFGQSGPAWQYGLSAFRWGQGAAADPLKPFERYDAVNNPKGLRMPAIGDMTPLTGALANARQYIQAARAADAAGSCRVYAVVLITDGLEEPLPAVTGTDPVGAVSALKSDKVPTYVVGFGVTGGLLDQMAQAAGTDVNGAAYDASDYMGLSKSLTTIMKQQMSQYQAHSKPTLTFDGKRVYTGYYSKNSLSTDLEEPGYLDAYSIASSVVGAAPLWKFSDKLNAMPAASRKVWGRSYSKDYLSNIDEMGDCSGDNDGLVRTIAPAWWCDNSNRDEANQNIYWVRNDRTGTKVGRFSDGTVRTSRLGSIDHSQPAAVAHPYFSDAWASPAPGVSEAGNFDNVKFFNSYKAFKNASAYQYASGNTFDMRVREGTVFVQSNDGLLHAIREDETQTTIAALSPWVGQERWAMAPKRTLMRWKDLRQGDERYGLDGPMALSDVCFGEANCERLDGKRWLTILVGAAGGGGNHLYALDVSDPTKPVWLWEYNPRYNGNTEDENMGETWSGPVIARVKIRGDSYRWGAFVGGGYESDLDSNCADWDDAKGNFFYGIDLDPGQRTDGHPDLLDDHNKGDADHGKRDENAKYCVKGENDTVDGANVSKGIPKNNIVARPRVVRPNDSSRASLIYFGDTDGKILRMDLTKDKTKDWKPKSFFNPFDGNLSSCPVSAGVRPLPDHAGANKALPLARPLQSTGLPPLTVRPILGVNDIAPRANGRTTLYVGSGQAFPVGNVNQRDVQNYFWAVEDNTGVGGEPCDGRPLWAYYLDFASAEKVVSEPTIIGPHIIVAVYVPPPAGPATTCGAAGRSKLYCFDRLTGDPKNCLAETTTAALGNLPATINGGADRCVGGNCSVVDVGAGVVSDLVAVGNTVLFNSEADPTPRQIAVSNLDQPFRVKSWRRVR